MDATNARPPTRGVVPVCRPRVALTRRLRVHVVRAADDDEFAELHVTRAGHSTQIDLGRDWRAHEAVTLDVGPVLHLDDAVSAKATALLGRALPRDFSDVAAAPDGYSRRELLELAFNRDRAAAEAMPASPCSGSTGSTTTFSPLRAHRSGHRRAARALRRLAA